MPSRRPSCPTAAARPQTRRHWSDNFLGVAMARSRRGETAPVRVATTGVFELDCPSETFELGDLVGVDVGGDHNTPMNQQAVKVGRSIAGHRTGCQAAAGGHDQRAGRHPFDRHDRRRRRRRRLQRRVLRARVNP